MTLTCDARVSCAGLALQPEASVQESPQEGLHPSQAAESPAGILNADLRIWSFPGTFQWSGESKKPDCGAPEGGGCIGK